MNGALALETEGGQLSLALHGETLSDSPRPVFALFAQDGAVLLSDRFVESACQEEGLLTLIYSASIYHMTLRIRKEGRGLRVSLLGRADWPEEAPEPVRMALPWLNGLRLAGAETRYPGAPLKKRNGETALQHKGMVFPPYCLFRPDGTGIAVYFPLEAAGLSWDTCRNQELCAVRSGEEMGSHRLHLCLTCQQSLLAEMEILPLERGWEESFENLKESFRLDLDFTALIRPDLSWLRDCSLIHFTYAFGREFLNPDTGLPDLNRLLDEGEKFGGYDALILWHEYPRLGLDERSQWDLFSDYPGGTAFLHELIRQAHRRGVRVIIPFRPWDRSVEENDGQTRRRIASLIRTLDADGLFFDTMNTVPAGLRKALDQLKPGVVFLVESEPVTSRAVSQVTGAWNQYHTELPMPEANLLRFLIPEQPRFGIARWHSGVLKSLAVERAAFNGEGMIIWQDVFGCWMPYTEAQKKAVSAWKTLFAGYKEFFHSADAMPLLPTAYERLYSNRFSKGDEELITLYLDGEKEFEGKLLRVPGAQCAKEVRLGLSLTVADGWLCGCVPPGKTAVIHVKKRRQQ